jgi:hypothetical protein
MVGRKRGRKPDPAKEAFWRDAIRRWKRSGLTVRGFCRQERLAEGSFYAWRREIARRERTRASAPSLGDGRRSGTTRVPARGPLFLPIHVRGGAPEAALGDGTIEVRLSGGTVLRAGSAVPPERLARLIEALEARPC